MQQNDRLAETTALSQQWVLALSDSQIALMRLYAYPDAQEEAERLAGLLRQLQLLSVEDAGVEPLTFVPTPPGEAMPADEQELRRKRIDMTVDFMQEMAKQLESVKQTFQTQGERTAALLAEMHRGAEALRQRFDR